jgi:hypothetical protein
VKRGYNLKYIRMRKEILGLMMPLSYRRFLEQFGYRLCGASEVYGLYND